MPIPISLPAFLVAFFTKYAGLLTILLSVGLFRVVIKVLTLLGVGLTTFVGFDALAVVITNAVRTQLEGLPNHMLQLLLILRADDAMTILISGYITALSLRIVNGLTRPTFVTPTN